MRTHAEPKQHTIYMLAALVFIIGAGLIAFISFNRSKLYVPTFGGPSRVEVPARQTSLPEEDLPPNFPSGVPDEHGTVENNIVTHVTTGRTQGLRRVTLQKTPTQTKKIYSDFLNSNGWSIIINTEKEGTVLLAAVKNNTFIKITIAEGVPGSSRIEVVVESE